MDAELSPVRQARAHHRHELRTLTYVTLDQANGGIVRNLSHEGMGVQVVAAVRPRQQLRVRFELRYPRLRLETRGEVMWATFSGQCGIRFLDLSPRMSRQINEWIFGNLLDGAALHADGERSILAGPGISRLTERPQITERHALETAERSMAAEDDGLMLSASPLEVIELPTRSEPELPEFDSVVLSSRDTAPEDAASKNSIELDWLSQPLSANGLVWTVNTLAVFAGSLLFALVFLSVTRELPKWPFAMLSGAATFVAVAYWGFFKLFGGVSLGKRLARLAGYDLENEEELRDTRFR